MIPDVDHHLFLVYGLSITNIFGMDGALIFVSFSLFDLCKRAWILDFF